MKNNKKVMIPPPQKKNFGTQTFLFVFFPTLCEHQPLSFKICIFVFKERRNAVGYFIIVVAINGICNNSTSHFSIGTVLAHETRKYIIQEIINYMVTYTYFKNLE